MKERLRQFMQGRYGADQLSRFGSILGLIIILAGLFTKVKMILYIGWAIYIYFGIYRVFSKNITKRRAENYKFLMLVNTIYSQSRIAIKRLKDLKTHKYFNCPNCRQKLRVPRHKGKISITCPVCKSEFIRKS